ncbi:hypothetical protein [Pseudomonas sp. BMS12]|uniref:hypothetical protein n=1 Tax=Pseudomonas sp. BMS12 TaxID=1796033 RepID=UPI000AECA28F|nr:hypothetical protein [Pseudomonas sp. BMS12]
MLEKMPDGTWGIYCDECGAYLSDLSEVEDEDEAEEEVICQECLNKDEDDIPEISDWRQKVANSLEDTYGPCPYGRKKLIQWIDDEVMRLKGRGVPAGEAATMEMALSYWGWIGDESVDPF